MLLQEDDEIEGAVLDLCQQRRGGRQTLAIEGLAEGVDELRVGVEDRHGRPCRRTRHVDRTFLAEPEAQSQRPSRGRETCRGEPGRRRDYRAACGEPLAERGVHLTAPRDVRSQRSCRRAFEHPASKARHELVTVSTPDLSYEAVHTYG